MKPEISNYMREMQRRSAEARWSGLSAAERAAKMSALAKARWAKTKRKPKRVDLRSNAEVSEGGTCDSRIETAAQSRPSLH